MIVNIKTIPTSGSKKSAVLGAIKKTLDPNAEQKGDGEMRLMTALAALASSSKRRFEKYGIQLNACSPQRLIPFLNSSDLLLESILGRDTAGDTIFTDKVLIPGLYPIVGAGMAGKSVLMGRLVEKLTEAAGTSGVDGELSIHIANCSEPEYPASLDEAAIFDFLHENAKPGDICMVDSFRDSLLHVRGGATLPGGVDSDWVEMLSLLHTIAFNLGIYVFVILNPLASDSQDLRTTITSMSAGKLELGAPPEKWGKNVTDAGQISFEGRTVDVSSLLKEKNRAVVGGNFLLTYDDEKPVLTPVERRRFKKQVDDSFKQVGKGMSSGYLTSLHDLTSKM